MNDTVAKLHARSVAPFNAAYAQEQANLQAARAMGDDDEIARAIGSMAGIRATIREMDRMAAEETNRQQAPMAGTEDLPRRDVELARHYGLSAHEISIAKGWTTDPNLTDEAKVRAYCENRKRYRQGRADGTYRDDQGRVTR